jgi:hypothetical protein
MSRFIPATYRLQLLLLMALYLGMLLLEWPLARNTTALPLKTVFTLTPLLPMLAALWLIAKRIMRSDELNQRVDLVALSVATGVVSALSLAGGFLSATGVVAFDGDVLIWVMPALALVYVATRWIVGRRYGGMGC